VKLSVIFWTDEAIHSLNSCVEFLESVWDEKIIEKFLDLIDGKIDLISSNPEIGSKVFSTDNRKLLIHENVSLYYKVDNSELKILLIWDNRQDPKKLLRDLKKI
jgi:plasmid stabilization system protein ParE